MPRVEGTEKNDPPDSVPGLGMAQATGVPESQVESGRCECCIRSGQKLYRVEWRAKGKKEHDWICYACKYNTFPPNHKLFVKVQQWRAAHHMSVSTRPAEAPVEGEESVPKQPAAWSQANDQRMLEGAWQEQKTGQIANLVGTKCAGPTCQSVIKAPTVVVYPESKKRRACWWVCSQECMDASYRNLVRGMRPYMFKRYDSGGRLTGRLVLGHGWLKPEEAAAVEPEFCLRCDRLVPDACDCTPEQLTEFYGPGGRASGNGAQGEPVTELVVVSHETTTVKSARPDYYEQAMARKTGATVTQLRAEAKVAELAGKELKKLHRKYGKQAKKEMEENQ